MRLLKLLLPLIVLAGCSSSSSIDTSMTTIPTGDANELVASVASYDLAVGEEQRLIVGLLTGDHRDIGYGAVRMRFTYQSDGSNASPGTPSAWQDATFLSLPDAQAPANPSNTPTVLDASGHGRGVYATQARFDRAGFYNVEVEGDVAGLGTKSTSAALRVREKHQFLNVGDEALRSKNLVASSTGVPAKAIDSRAVEGAALPDPQLHQLTIADSIAQRKPTVVAFATPVFCRSRFCGPTIDLIEAVAPDYSSRVNFIHVEIWKDFDKQQANDVASDWLLRDEMLPEPWVYLIDSNGKIAARWDNVVTRDELVNALNSVQ